MKLKAYPLIRGIKISIETWWHRPVNPNWVVKARVRSAWTTEASSRTAKKIGREEGKTGMLSSRVSKPRL